jgi:hypothetical protein
MYLRACWIAVIALCVGLAHSGLLARAEPAASFEAGETAYIAGNLDEARRIYAATAASPEAPAKDRAASARQLAVLAWRIAGDPAEAERWFASALALRAELSRTHVERARFYLHVGRVEESVVAAEAAIAAATNPGERRQAALAVARAALAAVEGKPIARQTPQDRARLARAGAAIEGLGVEPPLPLDLAEALLHIALRLDDGLRALAAWRSYARDGAEKGAWTRAGARLAVALPALRPGSMTKQLRADIVEGLAGSHFFDLAMLVAADERIANRQSFLATQPMVEVAAYAAAIADIRRKTDAYYRDVANGKANPEAWRAETMAAAQALWRQLSFDAPERPAFTPELFAAEAERRFDLFVSLGRTGGIDDMHAGHVFMDEARTIEQYGRKAELRRIALDRMISNGYESWLWDGRQQHGGWSRPDRVYQVRPAYADSALRKWDRLTDPRQRAEEEGRIARLTPSDDAIARANSSAYLPALAARLVWQGLNAIMDGLKAKGTPPSELKRRFLDEHDRIDLEANFFAHEGRHSLDAQAYGDALDSEELEFRAKLSEIAFSDQPRFSFRSIVNPNIADPKSPHGRANKRIMQGLVAWMDKNRTAIAGLDPARPLLPQLDKLGDEQMRAAMRSMDPWAPR